MSAHEKCPAVYANTSAGSNRINNSLTRSSDVGNRRLMIRDCDEQRRLITR